MPDGRQALHMSPLELLDHLAALIPPKRRHRHRYSGVFAPNAPLRSAVTACAGQSLSHRVSAPENETDSVQPKTGGARYLWAILLARIFEFFPLECSVCKGKIRIISEISDPPTITHILSHIGERAHPLPLSPARGPPQWEWDFNERPHEELIESTPEFEADQRISW